ncbi:MAG: aminotransferase class V-fold PLP-dependent enzyme, partial [Candidatus Neoclostridium sp.]
MKVYLDYSATTPISREVQEAMMPYFSEAFGNADSVHSFGRNAAYAVDEARRAVAKAINALPKEIFFTSGGTEADNFAIKGLALANADKGKRVIVSAIEHAAVLSSVRRLEKDGFEAVYLP